jgi:HlyD family secretion protein
MRRTLLMLLLLLAACRRDDVTTIEGHGTIEVTESDVAPLTTARVLHVAVDEGEMVHPGDTLVVLTQSSMPATIEAQRAKVLAAEAALTDLERGARRQEIQAAEAELSGAAAEVERSSAELARMRSLAAGHAISQQALDNAEAAARTATSRHDAAAERLALLQAGSRPDRIRQARADVANSRAALAATEATAGDLVLLASQEAIVLSRLAEPGEVLTPGTPALTLGEVKRPWVRVYLAARDVGRIKVGQSAEVWLDGVTDRSWKGTVTVVNPRAEFTPRAALTEEERADLMFGLRIEVDDTTGAVKPGLPATVRLAPLGSVS